MSDAIKKSREQIIHEGLKTQDQIILKHLNVGNVLGLNLSITPDGNDRFIDSSRFRKDDSTSSNIQDRQKEDGLENFSQNTNQFIDNSFQQIDVSVSTPKTNPNIPILEQDTTNRTRVDINTTGRSSSKDAWADVSNEVALKITLPTIGYSNLVIRVNKQLIREGYDPLNTYEDALFAAQIGMPTIAEDTDLANEIQRSLQAYSNDESISYDQARQNLLDANQEFDFPSVYGSDQLQQQYYANSNANPFGELKWSKPFVLPLN